MRVHVLLILFLFIRTASLCQPADRLDMNTRIDSIVQNLMSKYQIPGLALGVVRDHGVLIEKGYGYRSIITKTPVTERTVFHTASISKIFTAQCILKLISEDKLSFHTTVKALLPGGIFLDSRSDSITIGHIIEHRSGIPDLSSYHWENHHTDDAALPNYIAGLRINLSSDPGTRFLYSNLGYDILGYIVEKVSGQKFEDYARQNLFSPAGMNVTDFLYPRIPDSLRTAPHTRSISGNVIVRKIYPYTREHAGSSTLQSSATEMNRWMIHFLANGMGPLESAGLQKAQKFGLQYYTFGKLEGIGHFGGDKGFRAFLVMIPARKLGIIILANCDYHEDFRQELAGKILASIGLQH